MTTLWNTLGDKLVRRLVPKTTATACLGTQNGWYEACFCSNGYIIYKWCDVCGGITSCTPCMYKGGRC